MFRGSSKWGKVYNVLLERSERVVSTRDVRQACKLLGAGFEPAFNSMSRARVLEPLLFKGVYYVRNREERDLGILQSDALDVAAGACSRKLGSSWYFGLATALALNGLWEQQTVTGVTIVSKKRVKRKKSAFGGLSFEFKLLSGAGFEKGIKHLRGLRFSDASRTLVDYAYFGARSKFLDYSKAVCQEVFRKSTERNLLEKATALLHEYPRPYRVFIKKFLSEVAPGEVRSN